MKQDKPVDIVFLSPHQDDEVLTLGVGIVEHLLLGHRVAVCLVSDGAACTTRLHLANGKSCADLGDQHIYDFDMPTYGSLRDVEFVAACEALGVASEDILLLDPRQPDGAVDSGAARDQIAQLAARYPNAGFATHAVIEPASDPMLPLDAKKSDFAELESLDGKEGENLHWHSQHKDHRALAKAALELYQEGSIPSLECYVEFYHQDQFRVLYPGTDLVERKAYGEAARRIAAAVGEYACWDPGEERYALGLHSAHAHLRLAARRPLALSFVPASDADGDTPEASLARNGDIRKRVLDAAAACAEIEQARAKELVSQIAEIKESTTWKVGRAATALPRMVKDLIR